MSENALAKLDAANRALAEAKNLDDVRHIRDVALAAQTYARAAHLGLEAQNHAAEIKLRAERKAGEMLAVLEREQTSGLLVGSRRPSLVNGASEYTTILQATNITRQDANRWQQIASLPESTFEQHLEDVKADGRELTTGGVIRLFLYTRRPVQSGTPSFPAARYRVVYADPPWTYSNNGVIGSDNYGHAGRHYPAMSTADLCALDVAGLCEDDAVLFLWVTAPLLPDGLRVVDAWGFEYKTCYVWDKVRHNYGHYSSVRHELLLVCVRGSCLPDASVLIDSVQVFERSGHSVKPEGFRRIIETLYTHGKRIELFARARVPGWDSWGNEVTDGARASCN